MKATRSVDVGTESAPPLAVCATAQTAPRKQGELIGDAMWRDLKDRVADRSRKVTETASQEPENRVPTLTKSSYRLPAAAAETVDEQERSCSYLVIGLSPAGNQELDPHLSSGLQA